MSDELVEALLTGLPERDQKQLAKAMNRARDEQLERKVNPPKRRRRSPETGKLEWASET